MNLVLDIGNTNVKIGIFNNNKIIEYNSAGDFSLEQLQSVILKYPRIKNICLSNTSKQSQGVSDFCKDSKINFIKVDYTSNLPISIEYDNPETLGSDRIALAVGASIHYPGDKLIIDIGTCVTYDIVLEKRYIGGQISPGINMRLHSLNKETENLPKLDFEIPSSFIGRTTNDSILIGVYHGLLFEIQSVIEKYKYRYPNIITILTGGDLNTFKKKLKNINFINSYLLMEGLNYIIVLNEEI